jgi:hypothetical protein
MSTTPPPSGRSKKRSRLFQAAPDALFVEEWVPNITLPPPPDEPLLEEDEGGVKLDEHGLPERREEDEEPEEERKGPARIYVGPGAGRVRATARDDELPVSEVAVPDLSLPRGEGLDDEDDSDPSMPDLSIDGSGSDWGSMFDGLDDESPTDPELHSGEQDQAEPVPMPAAAPPEPEVETPEPPVEPAAEPAVEQPRAQAAPPKLDRPRSEALSARANPSWARPSGTHRKPSQPPRAKQEPPRIRPTQAKPAEPGLGALVPRSAIIAVVLLAILVVVVLVLRKQGSDPVPGPTVETPQPAGPPLELQIEPGTMKLDEPVAPPAPSVEPAAEAEPAEAEPVRASEPAPPPAPAPAAPEPRDKPAPKPDKPKPASQSQPAPAAAAEAPAPAAPPAAEPAAEPSGSGFLIVESDRYAMVYMGGRRLGGTPIARMELAPGSYAVRAVCRDTGATKTMQVEIQGGELTTASFRFMP